MHKKDINVPSTVMANQIIKLKFHPIFSDKNAIKYVDTALPIYVQELSTPETVETFFVFSKNGGIMQRSIKLTPCIHPVSAADDKTETTALCPVYKSNINAEIIPTKKNIHAQEIGFLTFFL